MINWFKELFASPEKVPAPKFRIKEKINGYGTSQFEVEQFWGYYGSTPIYDKVGSECNTLEEAKDFIEHLEKCRTISTEIVYESSTTISNN